MNYLKDRHSYISWNGGPVPKPLTIPDIFIKKEKEDGIIIHPFICHCGLRFRYYDEIKKHRRISQHFEKHTISNINKE